MIDLRSDTVSRPTTAMREAMASAEVGDDGYGEDPTTIRLEKMAAKLTGHAAALFVSSGTQGNLVALLVHCRGGDEFLVAESSHCLLGEVGAYAAVAGALPRIAPSQRGILRVGGIRDLANPAGSDGSGPTRLVWLENSHNHGGGTVYPLSRLKEIRQLAREKGLAIHMDGARVFNAATALGVSVRQIARQTDSITFCLSKSLGAPMGSLLCGTKSFIDKSRRFRRMLGGGLRQSGVVAAAGIVALETTVGKLATDHENAQLLARGLNSIRGILVEPVETNMVFFRVTTELEPIGELVRDLATEGVLVGAFDRDLVRMVTYHQISRPDIRACLKIVRQVVSRRTRQSGRRQVSVGVSSAPLGSDDLP